MTKWQTRQLTTSKSKSSKETVHPASTSSSCLLPLSWLLKITTIGYNKRRDTPAVRTNHLLFMDDLKLYANNDNNHESLLRLSENTVMNGIWAGKIQQANDQEGQNNRIQRLLLSNDDTIKALTTILLNDSEQHHQTNRQQGWNGRFRTSIMSDKKKSWKRTSAARTPSMLSTRLQHQITRTRLQYSTG